MTTTADLAVRTREGHTLIVEAEQTHVPGLAIWELPAEYLPPGFNTWRIVHAPSGRAIGSGPTRGNVLGAVAYLAPLTDWNRSVEKILADLDGIAVNWALHDAGCVITVNRSVTPVPAG